MNAKTLVPLFLVAVLAAAGGWFASSSVGTGGDSAQQVVAADGPCPGGAQPLYWKAPMDPTYVRDEPGKSPMGMDLVPACPGNDDASSDEGIRVDSNVLQSMGVRTATVEQRDLTRLVRAVGRVDYDERLIAHVHTKIQGWIEKLHVEYEGEVVRKGQPMIDVYSPDLVATQEELLVAARYQESMENSDFPDIRKGGNDLFEATKRRLELWDIPDRDIERLLATGKIQKTVTLYAPSSGVVTSIMARQGSEIGANDNLFTIADLSQVWIYADIYEYEIPWVAVGQTAQVELRNMPGRTFEAKLTYVYPFLDPKTRTVRVRLELPNPGLLLKPEMFANVEIGTETRNSVATVPEEAIIRSGRRNVVIVSLGNGRFEPRDVELGIDSGDGWIEIRKGLVGGEVAVTSGQFLIDSESNLQEAVKKLLGRDKSAKESLPEEHAGHDMPNVAPEKSTHDPHAGHSMDAMPSNNTDESHSMPAGHAGDEDADRTAEPSEAPSMAVSPAGSTSSSHSDHGAPPTQDPRPDHSAMNHQPGSHTPPHATDEE